MILFIIKNELKGMLLNGNSMECDYYYSGSTGFIPGLMCGVFITSIIISMCFGSNKKSEILIYDDDVSEDSDIANDNEPFAFSDEHQD